MGLKVVALVLFAAFTIVNIGTTESRHVDKHQNPQDIHSFLNDPKSKNAILDILLHSRDTSADQILNRIISADGNVEEAVKGVNEELKADILKIEGESVRISSEELQNLLRDGIAAALREKLSKNPALVKILEKRLEEKITNSAAEDKIVPLDVIRQFLEKHTQGRSKRSLEARDFDIGLIIQETLVNLLRGQLAGVITGLLDNVKVVIQGFYVATPPAGDLEGLLAYTVNTLVKEALALIVTVEQNLAEIITIIPVPNIVVNETVVARRKRATDNTSVTATDDQGLDVLLRPILELLATILTPVNQMVVSLADGLLKLLTPIIGTILVTRIRSILVAFINLLIPANPI